MTDHAEKEVDAVVVHLDVLSGDHGHDFCVTSESLGLVIDEPFGFFFIETGLEVLAALLEGGKGEDGGGEGREEERRCDEDFIVKANNYLSKKKVDSCK